MDVHVLLLLACLCTLSFSSPVMALQRDASTLVTAAVESVRQRSSIDPHSQEESGQEGLITAHCNKRICMQSSTNGIFVPARRLLSHGDQDDKQQQKNEVHKHDTTAIPPPPPAKPVEAPSPDVKKPDDQVKDNHPPPDKKSAIHCDCEEPKKPVSACLRIPGDGAHKLSLFIKNEGESEVRVTVVTPKYLTADRQEVSVSKGKSETIQFLMNSKYELSVLDSEAVKNQSITVITGSAKCKLAVPSDYLHSLVQEQKPTFSSYLPLSVTPRDVAYLVAIVLVVALVGAWLCYKCCGKKRGGDVKYQQLEMIVPGQSTPKERVEHRTGAWDDVWDDDWEDEEAAKSSSRLNQNLSARGLGARKGNKDGWDSSWED